MAFKFCTMSTLPPFSSWPIWIDIVYEKQWGILVRFQVSTLEMMIYIKKNKVLRWDSKSAPLDWCLRGKTMTFTGEIRSINLRVDVLQDNNNCLISIFYLPLGELNRMKRYISLHLFLFFRIPRVDTIMDDSMCYVPPYRFTVTSLFFFHFSFFRFFLP